MFRTSQKRLAGIELDVDGRWIVEDLCGGIGISRRQQQARSQFRLQVEFGAVGQRFVDVDVLADKILGVDFDVIDLIVEEIVEVRSIEDRSIVE